MRARVSLVCVCVLGVFGCARSELELPRQITRAAPDAGFVDSGAMDAGDTDGGDVDSGRDEPCRWGFAPQAKYEVPGYPVDIAIGDFDGDRRPDVLTVNSSTGVIALLKNLGRGELALRSEGPVGTRPFAFANADFSGDGSLDLAVLYLSQTESTRSWVSIYLNRGDGTFTSEVVYQNPGGGFGIVGGDLEGDGHVDLAVCDGSLHVHPLFNRGDGTFDIGPQYPTGAYASYLTLADFDGNGALDLGVAGTFSIAVLFNQGNGEFGSPVVYDNSSACNYVGPLVAGDLTGDGYPDLVRSCFQGGSVVAARMNDGSGRLSDEIAYPTGEWPFRLVMGDFTGHGRNDLAVANGWVYANSVSVLPNLGDGTFASTFNYDAAGPMFIAAGDLNGDGHPDLATAGSPGYPSPNGTVSVLLSTCQGPAQ